jgi:Domain of unknown function (DUF5915)
VHIKPELNDILAEEVNVKEVTRYAREITPDKSILEIFTEDPNSTRIVLDTRISPELKAEGLARDIIRHIQNARKQAGLQVDDRIALVLVGEGELATAIADHQTTIVSETLTIQLGSLDPEAHAYSVTVRVEGFTLTIALHAKTSLIEAI